VEREGQKNRQRNRQVRDTYHLESAERRSSEDRKKKTERTRCAHFLERGSVKSGQTKNLNKKGKLTNRGIHSLCRGSVQFSSGKEWSNFSKKVGHIHAQLCGM
jgi:hypothetical protein